MAIDLDPYQNIVAINFGSLRFVGITTTGLAQQQALGRISLGFRFELSGLIPNFSTQMGIAAEGPTANLGTMLIGFTQQAFSYTFMTGYSDGEGGVIPPATDLSSIPAERFSAFPNALAQVEDGVAYLGGGTIVLSDPFAVKGFILGAGDTFVPEWEYKVAVVGPKVPSYGPQGRFSAVIDLSQFVNSKALLKFTVQSNPGIDPSAITTTTTQLMGFKGNPVFDFPANGTLAAYTDATKSVPVKPAWATTESTPSDTESTTPEITTLTVTAKGAS